MAFAKALLPGAILTYILASLIYAGGSSGGVLYVHKLHMQDYSMAWSWPTFFFSTGLAWALYAMMGD